MQAETLNHCHVMEERGWLFRSEDSCSTEEEYAQLLYSLVYCLKPYRVLETGSFKGICTTFMAKALRRNTGGHITSLESNPKCVAWATELLRVNAVSEFATVIETDSMEFLKTTHEEYGFAFFDTLLPLRCKELKICLERGLLKKGAVAALHDTSRLRTVTPGTPDPQTGDYWKDLEAIEGISFIEFPLSRGLTLVQVK